MTLVSSFTFPLFLSHVLLYYNVKTIVNPPTLKNTFLDQDWTFAYMNKLPSLKTVLVKLPQDSHKICLQNFVHTFSNLSKVGYIFLHILVQFTTKSFPNNMQEHISIWNGFNRVLNIEKDYKKSSLSRFLLNLFLNDK